MASVDLAGESVTLSYYARGTMVLDSIIVPRSVDSCGIYVLGVFVCGGWRGVVTAGKGEKRGDE